MAMRAPTPPPFRAESPHVGEEQGSTTQTSRLIRAETPQGPEAHTLFRPDELFAHERSAELRRLEEDMAALRLDDIYGALSMEWQLDRKDINDAHGNDWDPGVKPDFWVSTDTGRVCFAAVPEVGHDLSEPGQYHKMVGGTWQCFHDTVAAPGNVGGVHGCSIETSQPAAQWTLVAKLADYGLVLGRDAGLRTEFAALVRNDSEAIIASVGPHDECRSLFMVDQVTLPVGRLALADPAELIGPEEANLAVDGPSAPAGMGAGYYPVFVSRDEEARICRVTVVFHPGRTSRVCRHFPPELEAGGLGDPPELH
mmetsp:Transcript_145909/g.254550  ORF Transcript_145909/g.254550 Transcript_145909/m.254550 type:complete len:311 (+) Transcript_145909:47-979(+)